MIILGIIIGILISNLILIIILIFRNPVNKILSLANRLPSITEIGMRKGFIIEPESELSEDRDKIIKENKKQGKITNLSDLYD